jgi:MFS family permease
MSFWGLWLQKEIGASITVIGLLAMVQNAQQLIFALPGGIIADKFGRKNLILFGTSMMMIPPIIYLLATTWEHVLIAVMFGAVSNLYMPAFDAMVADSVPAQQRGVGYGVYRMVTSLPALFMPIVGGVVIDALGFGPAVRMFNILTIFLVIAALILRAKYLTETLDRKSRGERKSVRETLSSALQVNRTVWVMVVVAVMGGFSFRMVVQFIPIYAQNSLLFTSTEIGVAQTAGSIVSSLLILPIGMLADRIGRKPLITMAQAMQPLTTWAIVLVGVGNFSQYLAIRMISGVGSALGGAFYGFAGGPAWQALLGDIIPREKRGTINGLVSTITGTIGTPSSVFGSYIWSNYSPEATFYVSLMIGMMSFPIFALFVKEPKKGEKF